jgi:hypothetical protein
MADTERKTFKIPHQIDHNFYIWRFITVKDLIFLLPTIALGYVIYQYMLPPTANLQFKVFFTCLPFILAAALVFVRPITVRKNINLFQQIRWRIRYNQRQKKFFYQRKAGE